MTKQEWLEKGASALTEVVAGSKRISGMCSPNPRFTVQIALLAAHKVLIQFKHEDVSWDELTALHDRYWYSEDTGLTREAPQDQRHAERQGAQ